MSYVKIILFVLEIINKWMDKVRDQGLIDRGRDEAIAVQAREIFRKTQYAQKTMEEVNAMSNEEVDAALVALEPSSPANPVPPGGPVPLHGAGDTTGNR